MKLDINSNSLICTGIYKTQYINRLGKVSTQHTWEDWGCIVSLSWKVGIDPFHGSYSSLVTREISAILYTAPHRARYGNLDLLATLYPPDHPNLLHTHYFHAVLLEPLMKQGSAI